MHYLYWMSLLLYRYFLRSIQSHCLALFDFKESLFLRFVNLRMVLVIKVFLE
jgi:hypothetical protein